jgi:hypothetical protein
MIPEDAFIYPHEPMVVDKFREALIFPEDPFPKRDEGGIVVGMDGTTEHGLSGQARGRLHPNGVAEVLDALSTDLKQNGIVGLRIEPGVSTFETDLKAHLAEYFSKNS